MNVYSALLFLSASNPCIAFRSHNAELNTIIPSYSLEFLFKTIGCLIFCILLLRMVTLTPPSALPVQRVSPFGRDKSPKDGRSCPCFFHSCHLFASYNKIRTIFRC